jgi:hypothetical protein
MGSRFRRKRKPYVAPQIKKLSINEARALLATDSNPEAREMADLLDALEKNEKESGPQVGLEWESE